VAAAGAVSLLASAGSLLLLRALDRQRLVAARLLTIQQDAARSRPAGRGSNRLLRLVAALGTALARSGALSTATLAQLEQTLLSAGLRGGNGLGLFVGSKLLLLLGLPALAWFGLRALQLSPLPHMARWPRRRCWACCCRTTWCAAVATPS